MKAFSESDIWDACWFNFRGLNHPVGVINITVSGTRNDNISTTIFRWHTLCTILQSTKIRIVCPYHVFWCVKHEIFQPASKVDDVDLVRPDEQVERDWRHTPVIDGSTHTTLKIALSVLWCAFKSDAITKHPSLDTALLLSFMFVYKKSGQAICRRFSYVSSWLCFTFLSIGYGAERQPYKNDC